MPLVTTSGRKIAIVGEAPGAEEEQLGVPFVGASGNLLDRQLQKVGVLRSACYIGNVFQYRPPGNKIELVDRNDPKWVEGVETLRRELTEFQPTVIFALGGTALEVLTGKTSITKWRGSCLPCTLVPGLKVLPSLHPAYVLRNYGELPILNFDCQRLLEESYSKEIPKIERNLIIRPSLKTVLEYLESCKDANRLAIDFETTKGNAAPICLGFAKSEFEALCIPFGPKYWAAHEEDLIWQAIDKLVRSPVRKVFHNALFDCGVFIYWCHILPANVWMDTMIAHHACYPELPKSLAFLTSIYTKQPYYKGMHKESGNEDEKSWSDKVSEELLWQYNCLDCCVTYEISKALELNLASCKAGGGYKLDMEGLSVALYMMLKGIKVDEAKRIEAYNKLAEEVEISNHLLKDIYGYEINVKSPAQLKELLYEELKLPPVYNKEGKLTANADALLELALKTGDPNLRVILKTVQLRTKLSFFDSSSLNLKDGRIHASFNVAGTETGRWSSSSSFLGGRGIMNVPEDCRKIYVADPGKILVGWDKAQAEARVVAYKSALTTGDTSYQQLVESGEKVHVWFGRQLCHDGVFKCAPEEVKPGTPEYFIAKVGVHAFSYGMGPMRFCKVVSKETDGQVNISLAQARAIKDSLYSSLKALPKWQAAIREHLANSRVMFNAFGRSRVFFARWGDELFGEAYAFEPQSTVADDVAQSILRCFNMIDGLEVLQQNYDSLLAQCNEGEEKEIIEKMRPLVTEPIKLYDFTYERSLEFRIPVVFKVGYNWGEMEELA